MRRTGLAWLALAALVLAGCAPFAPRWLDAPSAAAPVPVAPAPDGPLADVGATVLRPARSGQSAIVLLEDNVDALKARIALVDLAVEALDVQYFIWQEDMTGDLLLERLLAAADRGVRVRLLLDDLALGGRDADLAGLMAHPRVELRLFNAWHLRRHLGRPLEFVARMPVLNHRMHNKVLIADGHLGIIGGRNIGDRYFGVYDRFVQNDIDLLMAGPLLDETARSFAQYWASEESVVPNLRAASATAPTLDALRVKLAASIADSGNVLHAFDEPSGEPGWRRYLDELSRRVTHGHGALLQDSPQIREAAPTQLYEEFKAFLRTANADVVLSSPYLVPDRHFIGLLGDLVDRGVRVRIVTNSLASNSHVVAHSAYKRWRRALLAAGAEIYEMRPDAEVLEHYKTPPVEPEWLALHTKAAVIDERFSFVGSPNVDPRSMILNTEIGVIVDDERLAAELIELLERDMLPSNAWRVTLEEGGWLKWWDGDEALGRQPAQGFQQRLIEFFINLVPIKNQT